MNGEGAGMPATADFPETAPTDILDSSAAGGTVIRGTVLRVGGYVASVGLNVVAAALLIRYLGASDFGRYTTVVSLVTIVAGLTEAGMTSVGVREYSVLETRPRNDLMRNLLGLRFVLTFVGVAGSLAFAIVAGYDATMIAGTALGGFGLLVAVWQATLGIPLQSGLRLGWVAGLDLLRQALTVVAIIALVVGGASLLALLSVPLVVGVIVLAIMVPLVGRAVPLRPSYSRRDYGHLLAITVPYAAATAVGVLYAYLIVVLMWLVSSQKETGYFSASFRIFVALGGLTAALVTSAFPVLARAARDDQLRLKYGLQRLWEICLIIGTGLAVCAAIGAPFAIDVVAGSGFDTSVTVLRIQAPAILATYLIAWGGFALLSVRQHRALLVANAIALVVSGGAVLALSPSYGAVGGAVATLLGESALALSYAIFLYRVRPDLGLSYAIVPRLAVAAALALAVVFLPVAPVAGLAIAAATFVAAVLILRVVPAEIWAALRERRSEASAR